MSKMRRMLGSRAAFSVGITLVYVLAFIPLYNLVWRLAIALSIVPIIVVAKEFGLWGGLVGGLVFMAFNLLLLLLAGESGLSSFLRGDFWTSHVVYMSVGVIVGYLFDVRTQLKKQLSEGKLAEEELRKHRDHLEELVGERTAELRRINEELEQEIAERARAEELLKELFKMTEQAKEEWESTADSLPELICLVDDQGRIIRANRTVGTWNLGQVVDVKGRGIHELLHPGCADTSFYFDSFWKQASEEVIRGQPAQCEAYDEVLKRHVLIQVQAWKGAAVGSTVVTVHDITERKRAEEALTEYSERLEEMVEERTAELKMANEQLRLEIAEHKRAEGALRDEKALMDALMDNITDSIYFKDRQCRLTRISRKMMRDLNLDEMSQAIGKTDVDLFGEEFGRKTLAEDQRIMATGEPLMGLIESRQLEDGQINWTLTTKVPLRDASGQIVGLAGITREINELMRAEEALQQREAVLGAIALATEKFLRPSDWEQDMQAALAYLGKAVDAIRVIIWEASTGEDGKYLISGRYEWLAPEAQLTPMVGLQNVPVFRRWRDLLPRGEIVTGHVRDFSAKEQEFFVPRGIESVLVVPIFVNDAWWGFMGFDQGATGREWTEAEIDALKTAASIFGGAIERKRAEEALAQERNLLRALLDNIPDAIYFKDAESRFISTNKAHAERWFGLSDPAQAIGKTDFDFFSEEHAQQAYENEQEIIRTGQPLINMEEKETWPDRPDTWVSTTKMPLRDAEGRIIGTFGITRDITERKRAEEQLQRYAAELERANEEIKQFAYIVSHDLRAPLVNLKGFTTELRFALETVDSAMDTALPHLDEKQQQEVTLAFQEDVPEALGFIDSSVTHMDRFVSALLKLSRLGRRELHLESVDTEALVQATLQTLAHQIEERQVKVAVGPLPQVVADQTSMEQVMANLLDNAVKYLDPDRPGQIEITAERSYDETTFRIRDNGRGIAREDMDKVFVPFRRFGRQDVPGEGMGLSYVQALVRRHGGRIWCESEPGVGTTFSFTIRNQTSEVSETSEV